MSAEAKLKAREDPPPDKGEAAAETKDKTAVVSAAMEPAAVEPTAIDGEGCEGEEEEAMALDSVVEAHGGVWNLTQTWNLYNIILT